MFNVSAQITNGTIQFIDPRSGQVVCEISSAAGVTLEGVAVVDPATAAAVAIVAALPTEDPADGLTIWNDGGVLKVSEAA